MNRFAIAASLLVASVAAADECSSSVSETIIATIDNSTYYDTCAVEDEGVTFNVSSLFDILNFTDSEFIQFCNSSTCLEPVHEMVHSIPSDCLILYDGTERNLSEEVTALHDQCHKALGTEDTDDDTTDSDDDMPMSMSMSMSMDMDGTSTTSSSSTTGSSAASTVSSAVTAIAACIAVATLV